MRVLLIKLSSMGDLIHTLPALTDAMAHIKNLEVTWVIEPSFQEVASWHPAVYKIIPMPLRSRNYRGIWAAVKEIRKQKYDLVIDAQGLLKSAIIARIAKSKDIAGFDWPSAREHVASFFYKRKYNCVWSQHAVVRLRKLFAQIFNYQLDLSKIDYGIAWSNLSEKNTNNMPYIMFLHGTTWESKHWPDANWFDLADIASQNGFAVQVTHATPKQTTRASALTAKCSNVKMLPHLTLTQALNVLQNASAVVAVDTGFAHLAAALNKPLVAIYGPTDVVQSGTIGNNNINLAAKFKCAPCEKKICFYEGEQRDIPPCFAEITPKIVWENLQKLFAQSK